MLQVIYFNKPLAPGLACVLYDENTNTALIPIVYDLQNPNCTNHFDAIKRQVHAELYEHFHEEAFQKAHKSSSISQAAKHLVDAYNRWRTLDVKIIVCNGNSCL